MNNLLWILFLEEPCVDLKSAELCDLWKMNKLCIDESEVQYQFVRKNCRMTCGLCITDVHPKTTTTTTSLTTELTTATTEESTTTKPTTMSTTTSTTTTEPSEPTTTETTTRQRKTTTRRRKTTRKYKPTKGTFFTKSFFIVFLSSFVQNNLKSAPCCSASVFCFDWLLHTVEKC